MSDLNRALHDIGSIRRQLAHATEFRGLGPATLATTGLLALAAAAAQSLWLPDPATHTLAYVALWIATAILSAALIAAQMLTRSRRIHSGLADAMLRIAAGQFLPSLATGALLTLVFLRFVSASLWMLPGLWQLVFGLGLSASCRFLPRSVAIAAAWYLLSGLTCLAMAGTRALSPWTMGIAYGAGQFLLAAILLLHTSETDGEAASGPTDEA